MSEKKDSNPQTEDSASESIASGSEATQFGGPERGSSSPDLQTAECAENFDNIVAIQKELEKAKSDVLYLRAEFDNFRKRSIKERSDLIKYGNERVLVEFLNVLDNLDRAMGFEVSKDNFDNFLRGVELISEEFKNLLGKHNVEEIPSEKLPFDPNYHEALSSEPTSEIPPGYITRVFKKGYRLHDRVIRPAQVIVATEPPDDSQTSDQ